MTPFPACPTDFAKICAIPTAKVGAPPVRPIIVFSPTAPAKSAICRSVTGNPSAVIVSTTAAGSPRRLIAKYSPAGIEQAATRAKTPTHISVIIAP
ncbi:MAG: hypothetical protein EBS97_04330 [Verrucomicrobia bacterium]|nr:hypothetical protein [Verrucomicrobiota bacterium]